MDIGMGVWPNNLFSDTVTALERGEGRQYLGERSVYRLYFVAFIKEFQLL